MRIASAHQCGWSQRFEGGSKFRCDSKEANGGNRLIWGRIAYFSNGTDYTHRQRRRNTFSKNIGTTSLCMPEMGDPQPDAGKRGLLLCPWKTTTPMQCLKSGMPLSYLVQFQNTTSLTRTPPIWTYTHHCPTSMKLISKGRPRWYNHSLFLLIVEETASSMSAFG